MITHIHVAIPYAPNRRLADAYNKIMEETDSEWVCFVDHDVYLATQPKWYQMCLNAVNQLEGQKIGWITAKCNRIGCKRQNYIVNPDPDDIKYHVGIAKKVYEQYGEIVSQLGKTKLSGFFILTNKTAWKDVGGFKDQGKGLSKIDNDYSVRLRKEGYGQYIIEGLYFYHMWKKIKKELYK